MNKQITIIIVLVVVGLVSLAGSYQTQQQVTPQQQIQILQQQLDIAEQIIGEQEIYKKRLELVINSQNQTINVRNRCLDAIAGFRHESASVDSVLENYGM